MVMNPSLGRAWLVCLALYFISMMQEYQAKDKQPQNHRKGTGIVRVCRWNEPLVLSVFSGTHRNLKKTHRNLKLAFHHRYCLSFMLMWA